MLKKFNYHCGKCYWYNKKQDFISNLCMHLQDIKKEYKKIPLLFHNHFIINHAEEWFFDIVITDSFYVKYCSVTLLHNKQSVTYFTEKEDKYCKNITEIRTFLKREVLKEG